LDEPFGPLYGLKVLFYMGKSEYSGENSIEVKWRGSIMRKKGKHGNVECVYLLCNVEKVRSSILMLKVVPFLLID
jgi:hypothetical protein